MEFNYSVKKEAAQIEPEYLVPYGQEKPPVQAQGSVSYQKFINIVNYLWTLGHPEICFIPFADNNIYDPEKGYIIYSLVRAKPAENFIKPRFHRAVDHPQDATKKIAVFIQSFTNVVKFTAVHKNPKMAEEMIENFQLFMLESTPIFIGAGVEDFAYGERPADEHKTRYGEDIAARSVMYIVRTQLVLTTDMSKLEAIIARVSVMFDQGYEDATPYDGIEVDLFDNYSTIVDEEET